MFASIDMPVPDKNIVLSEIHKVDEQYWFWEGFRATTMLPLMTKNSGLGVTGSSNKIQGEYTWTSFAPPTIIKWFEEHVFPFLGMKTRVMLLRTEPNSNNNEHVDCGRNEIGTRQHKFRWVVDGDTSTLYFITKSENVTSPKIDLPFIMDGGWPHGMNNIANKKKYTIVAGSPWNGNDSYDSRIKILLNRTNYQLPENCDGYF
jgi:hypothetical protein